MTESYYRDKSAIIGGVCHGVLGLVSAGDRGGDLLIAGRRMTGVTEQSQGLAQDFVPETRAAAECINAWLTDHSPEAGAAAVGRLANPLGTADFAVRGQTISALAQPYRFYLLQRVQAIYAGLAASDQSSVGRMLEACGMSEIFDIKLDRPLGRSGNLEVWQA